MTFPKARLAVSICLLVGWLGFLFYLVVTSHRFVLSRPQFLIAEAIVVIEVRDDHGKPDPDVTVDEVLWPPQMQLAKLQLPDIVECKREHGYYGAGKYLVPLMRTAGGFSIAPIPRVPTFPRQAPTHGSLEAFGVFSRRVVQRMPAEEARQLRKELEAEGYKVYFTEEELRIYPWSPDMQAQVMPLIAAKK
jgi:hypothetical protein